MASLRPPAAAAGRAVPDGRRTSDSIGGRCPGVLVWVGVLSPSDDLAVLDREAVEVVVPIRFSGRADDVVTLRLDNEAVRVCGRQQFVKREPLLLEVRGCAFVH